MKRVLAILFLATAAFALRAQNADSADGATVKNDTTYALHGDQQQILTDKLKLPFDVEVNTNGEFKVADGKFRKIAEGQIVRKDGWLLNPDGSVEPVFDHVTFSGGKIIVVRDGEATTLAADMTFSNATRITLDGWCAYPDGSRQRLVDGQLFHLDGSVVPAKDTITLKNGAVVVQKSGKLIPLAPGKIMGMNDGTRIHGEGFIENRDGSTKPLKEGETILVDGPAVGH